eukprot:scaffold48823_cov27-Tisochrysis_lutea.AAC.4
MRKTSIGTRRISSKPLPSHAILTTVEVPAPTATWCRKRVAAPLPVIAILRKGDGTAPLLAASTWPSLYIILLVLRDHCCLSSRGFRVVPRQSSGWDHGWPILTRATTTQGHRHLAPQLRRATP